MQNPELDVHQIRTTREDELFLDLVTPFLNGNKDKISSYRLKHVIPDNGQTVYAVYEMNHSILAVQFYYHDRLLNFCDEKSVQFMSMDEIRLIRELGEITIDGISYSIESMNFNLIDGAAGCQHMIIFNLQANY